MNEKFLHKNSLKFIFCASVLMMLFMISMLTVEAQEVGLESFGIEIATEDDEDVYTVKWWQQEKPIGNEYYITIPYSEKEQTIKADFTSNKDVYLNGIKLENGQILENLEKYNILLCDEEEYRLHVMHGSNIPTMHITTESGDINNVYQDREYKECAYAKIIENGVVKYEGELEYIKGRGNYSWSFFKKPFNIKFQEKKDLFEMGSAKKWCLLANHLDDTLLKNKLGYLLAESVGFQFSPQGVFVDLYIDEEYIGHYLLSEKAEIGKGRVNITNLDKMNELVNPDINWKNLELGGIRGETSYSECGSTKWVEIPNTPEVTSGGYLIEVDLATRYVNEKSGFVSGYGQPVTIKDPEYASKEQVEYISTYYQEFEDAVLSGDGYNTQGKHYSDYIDIAAVAKMYVFQEFIKNVDGSTTSLFFYKDVGGKLTAGPVWDVDLAFGYPAERNGVNMADPNGKWATGGYLQNQLSDKYTIFSLLCRHNDFRKEAQRQWEEYFQPNIEAVLSELEIIYNENRVSCILDRCRWNTNGGDFMDRFNGFENSVRELREFILQRKNFMKELFSDEVCYIEYNSNGGSGIMYDLENYDKGTRLILAENVYKNEDRLFLGWNTKASGWGKEYEDMSEIVLEKDVTLYAQWEKRTFREKLNSFILGIVGN